MPQSSYFKLIRLYLKFGLVYMIAEAIIHFSNIRLLGLENFWPESAILSLQLFMYLWATASVFVVFIIYFILRYPKQSLPLLKLMGFFTLFHAIVLLYLSRIPYETLVPTRALHFWIPAYHWWLRIEALMLLFFPITIFYGHKKKFLP